MEANLFLDASPGQWRQTVASPIWNASWGKLRAASVINPGQEAATPGLSGNTWSQGQPLLPTCPGPGQLGESSTDAVGPRKAAFLESRGMWVSGFQPQIDHSLSYLFPFSHLLPFLDLNIWKWYSLWGLCSGHSLWPKHTSPDNLMSPTLSFLLTLFKCQLLYWPYLSTNFLKNLLSTLSLYLLLFSPGCLSPSDIYTMFLFSHIHSPWGDCRAFLFSAPCVYCQDSA